MLLLLLTAFLATAAISSPDWLVWGGPTHNFISPAPGRADKWPAAGPKRLWSRPLGDGYSGIAEEAGVLYTAFRRSDEDVIVALDVKTGKNIWEYGYKDPFTNAFTPDVGPGPYAMPQIDRQPSADRERNWAHPVSR
jgi:hypothetical protein